LKQFKTGEDL